MKKLKILIFVLAAFLIADRLTGQDPSFSQFFSSPLNINPALTGDINGKWRVISNYRSQWIGPGNPYSTGTISFDSKIFQNVASNYVDENTRIGIGAMIMDDKAMAGVLKSNYASFNVSGNIMLKGKTGYELNGARIRHNSKIKMDQTAEQRLGVGLSLSYGHKQLDISKMTFGEQFVGYGFDTNLPSGEIAFSKMKAYASTNAGIIYNYIKDKLSFDLGASAYHLNKPKQTFFNDDNQYLPTRYVLHGNLETYLTRQLILNTNAVYQYQSGASYFSVGGALGYYLPNEEKDVIINGGLWYWSNNAVIPYVGFAYGNFQIGITYDITISKLNDAPKRPQTFELSLVVRQKGKSTGVIPSPWK